ncbi:MAG: hypothetical protein Q8N17_26035 [Burkholderiaceae bacterium]|nr:hypothetical protein [Burkholderiaceae bacterium]
MRSTRQLLGKAQVVNTTPVAVALGGGLDLVSTPMFAKPGTARLAYNYEAATGGGYERVGGIEKFDGRTNPNLAEYAYLECTAAHTALLGDTVVGATSAATGVVIHIDGAFLAVTRITGAFEAAEVLEVAATPVGTIASIDPLVDGFLDNTLSTLAAASYRADITAVPGAGRVRGLAALADTIYAWRDNVGATAMVLHKSTTSGWTAVALLYELSFTVGSVEPAEASTITQGSASATVRRVVKESGDWGAGTAAGRYIITIPTGGAFTGGALATAGAGTVPGAGAGVYHGTQITLSPGGRVRTDTTNFDGTLNSRRLYGCDGVNREFELADDILVPLTTGQTIRASAVVAFRNHLCFAFRGNLQHSGINAPYAYTVRSGATELATGDLITDLVAVAGSEVAAALMILCENSIHVMYGDSSADWVVKVLSKVSGSSSGSAQDIAGVVALDAPGFVRYPPTQAFGNYRWDSVSQEIEPIARGQAVECSVWVADRSKYRVFFEDGSAVSGMPKGKSKFDWATIDYGRVICHAIHTEIAGIPRTFVADTAGFVYECDVGRSFAGEEVQYALRLNELSQGSPGVVKQYKRLEIEGKGDSAFTLSVQAEFFDGDDDIDPTTETAILQPGAGLVWDLANWDESYWDVAATARRRFPLEGLGTSVAITMAGNSDSELPHTLSAITTNHIPRRQAR